MLMNKYDFVLHEIVIKLSNEISKSTNSLVVFKYCMTTLTKL